jgi:hypothetical protein
MAKTQIKYPMNGAKADANPMDVSDLYRQAKEQLAAGHLDLDHSNITFDVHPTKGPAWHIDTDKIKELQDMAQRRVKPYSSEPVNIIVENNPLVNVTFQGKIERVTNRLLGGDMIITTGALELATPTELEAAMAHEVQGHVQAHRLGLDARLPRPQQELYADCEGAKAISPDAMAGYIRKAHQRELQEIMQQHPGAVNPDIFMPSNNNPDYPTDNTRLTQLDEIKKKPPATCPVR